MEITPVIPLTASEKRAAIVAEAKTWIGTPYKSNGRIKGVGVNCAQLIYGIALNAGAIPPDSPEPRWYSPQLHLHSKEERLVEYFKSYGATEIRESDLESGDIVVYKMGNSHGHAGIVCDAATSTIIHCAPPRGCVAGRIDDGFLRAAPRRYFTLWPKGTGDVAL